MIQYILEASETALAFDILHCMAVQDMHAVQNGDPHYVGQHVFSFVPSMGSLTGDVLKKFTAKW